MQRAFDKWLELQAVNNESPAQINGDASHGAHSQALTRRGRRLGYGNKNAEALKRIKAASPSGLTPDELFAVFTAKFGAKYKRSSMRAMLWNQKKLGKIENRNGRYVIAPNGQHT
ncbi:MAG: hypothetical protein ACREC9_06305 [Methylocella sp.]